MYIDNWTDGYLAVRQRAFEVRGFIELDNGARWPRTTGHDVIAIAALFDPAVNSSVNPGLASRWNATYTDLEVGGVASPRDTFFGNRTFWSTLASVAVALDDVDAPVPALRWWNALIATLGMHERNALPSDGPFKHFENVNTFDDLYIEQAKYLRELRGSDLMKPEAGTGGIEKPIPRATNADVIALAEYWTKQLADAKHVMGHDGIVAAWKAATGEVDQIARHGDPSATYSKNNAFFRTLGNVAIQVAVADESPTKWDMAKDALKESVTHLPDNLGHAASKSVDFVASTANAVGRVANAAGKGLFEGFGTPLLIGAGLIGLFLITRSGENAEA